MTKVNYTAENIETAKSMYAEGGNDALPTIAEALGKSVRSVRAKLVHEGVYEAPVKEIKAPIDNGPSKKEMLAHLETLTDVVDTNGLMAATKATIASVIALAGGSVDDIDYDVPEGAVKPDAA